MVWVVSLSTAKLISRRPTAAHQVDGIRSLVGLSNLSGPQFHPVLYLQDPDATLALKLFRGEQAISEFGWHFTPTHTSSDTFATVTGSRLQRLLCRLHAAHG